MGICQHCSAIASKLLYDEEDVVILGTSVKTHHWSYADLENSALTCSLCELIVKQMRQLPLNEDWGDIYPEIWYTGIKRTLHGYDFQWKPTLANGAKSKDSNYISGFEFWCRGNWVTLDWYTGEDTAAEVAKNIIGRPIHSTENFEIAKYWIRTCLDHHSRCWSQFSNILESVGDQDILPTRVIDVGDLNGLQEPYLHDYSSSDRPYVALSHCWGESNVVTTTKENLAEHKKKLSLDRLSKTFQDAVHITRNIGVRYLWIDSLCIVQGDFQDWDRESPKMGYIYMYSILNIAATPVLDGDSGFLTFRTDEQAVRIPVDPENASVAGHIYIRNSLEPFYKAVNDGPLTKRAWVQQERLLSRRTLHCANDQMHWECHEACESEDGRIEHSSVQTKSTLSFDNPYSLSSIEGEKDPVYKRWYEVVHDYSSRNMTKATDKLPALSGVASLVADCTNDQYLAGLWRKDLVNGLLWCASRKDAPRLTRPPSWRAPSWSWAALDGSITFGYGPLMGTTRHNCIDILEASVEISGQNPYGMVSNGHITLSGRVVQIGYEIRTESMDYFISNAPSMQDLLYDQGRECGHARFDEADFTGVLYGLEVFSDLSDFDSESHAHVILLKAAAKENVYHRVGTGSVDGHIFNKSKERLVII